MKKLILRIIHWVIDFMPMQQVIRYTISGTTSTVADIFITWFLKEHVGLIPRVAALGGFFVSIVISYTFATLWIFNEHRFSSRIHELLPYLFITLVGAGLTWCIMYLGVNLLNIYYLAVKIFAVGVVAVWNFAAKKILIFSTKGPGDYGERKS